MGREIASGSLCSIMVNTLTPEWQEVWVRILLNISDFYHPHYNTNGFFVYILCRGLRFSNSHMECREFDSQSSQTNDLRNWYLSLPNLARSITKVGHGPVSSVSGLGNLVMVLVAWFPIAAAL